MQGTYRISNAHVEQLEHLVQEAVHSYHTYNHQRNRLDSHIKRAKVKRKAEQRSTPKKVNQQNLENYIHLVRSAFNSNPSPENLNITLEQYADAFRKASEGNILSLEQRIMIRNLYSELNTENNRKLRNTERYVLTTLHATLQEFVSNSNTYLVSDKELQTYFTLIRNSCDENGDKHWDLQFSIEKRIQAAQEYLTEITKDKVLTDNQKLQLRKFHEQLQTKTSWQKSYKKQRRIDVLKAIQDYYISDNQLKLSSEIIATEKITDLRIFVEQNFKNTTPYEIKNLEKIATSLQQLTSLFDQQNGQYFLNHDKQERDVKQTMQTLEEFCLQAAKNFQHRFHIPSASYLINSKFDASIAIEDKRSTLTRMVSYVNNALNPAKNNTILEQLETIVDSYGNITDRIHQKNGLEDFADGVYALIKNGSKNDIKRVKHLTEVVDNVMLSQEYIEEYKRTGGSEKTYKQILYKVKDNLYNFLFSDISNAIEEVNQLVKVGTEQSIQQLCYLTNWIGKIDNKLDKTTINQFYENLEKLKHLRTSYTEHLRKEGSTLLEFKKMYDTCEETQRQTVYNQIREKNLVVEKLETTLWNINQAYIRINGIILEQRNKQFQFNPFSVFSRKNKKRPVFTFATERIL